MAKAKNEQCIRDSGISKSSENVMKKLGEFWDAAEKKKGSPLTHKEKEGIRKNFLNPEKIKELREQGYVRTKQEAIDNLTAYIVDEFAQNPKYGIQAVMWGTEHARKGAARSIGMDMMNAENDVSRLLHKRLSNAGLWDIASSEKHSADIEIAKIKLDRGESTAGLNPDVVRTAELLNTTRDHHLEAGLIRGIITRAERDRVSPSVLNPTALMQSGGKKGDEARFLDFKKTMKDTTVELDKLFPEVTGGDYDNALRHFYQELVDGRGNTFEGMNRGFSMGIPFRTSEGQAKFISKYGYDTLSAARSEHQIKLLQRNIVLHDRTGGGGKGTLVRAVDNAAKILYKQGDTRKAGDLRNYWDEKGEGFWRMASGANARDINPEVTSILATIKSLITTPADLTLSGLSTIGDVGLGMHAAIQPTGGGMMKLIKAAVPMFMRSFARYFSFASIQKRHMDLAHDLGIPLQAMMFDQKTRFVESLAELQGGRAKIANFLFNLTGITRMSDFHRLEMGTKYMRQGYELTQISNFKELPVTFQRHLKRNNIRQGDWDIIRKHGIIDATDGNKYLSHVMLDAIPVDSIPKEVLGKRTASQYRTQLRRRMNSAMQDVMNHGMNDPDMRSDYFTGKRFQQGSVERMAMSEIFTYLSFVVNRVMRTTGKLVTGHTDDVKTPIQGFTDTFIKGGVLTNPTQRKSAAMLSLAIPLGISILSLKDIAKGRTPYIPETPKEWLLYLLEAASAAGMAPIFFDMLSKKPGHGYGPLEMLVGAPILKRALDLLGGVAQALDGDGSGFLRTLYRLGKKSTPGVAQVYGHWVTRGAMDQLVGQEIEDWIKPGTSAKLKKRLKDQGQEQFYK